MKVKKICLMDGLMMAVQSVLAVTAALCGQLFFII